MDASHYSLLSALIFSLVVVLQSVRIVRNWPVTVGTTPIPVWVSWVACVIAAVLALLGFSAYKPENVRARCRTEK
jgi:TRAP-type C4-dicarboxylate transport system permease small subunit